MSNKAPSAKKPKTASAPKSVFVLAVYSLVILIALSLLVFLPSKRPQDHFVCIDSSCIRTEYADSPGSRARGLSGRLAMPGEAGMLFIFDEPGRECMWMKDMKFNLDMVWMDQNRRIINIVRNISPDTFPKVFCADNTRYVLELNSGMAHELKLNIGDLAQL